jgi:hypothetical protein
MTDQLPIPQTRDLPARWIELRKEHLLGELALQPAAERRRRRFTLVVMIPAAIALLAATAFTTYALTREPTHLESVGCFDRADLEANTAIVNADGRDPVVICAEIWRRGGLGAGPAPERLEACVLTTGAIGVFPASEADTCRELGLAPLPPSYSREAKRFAALREAIVSRLGEPASGSSKRGPQCVGEEAARGLVRSLLDAYGYSDWRIDVVGGQFDTERPCAEPSFDTGEKVVLLVPASR